MPTRLWVLCLLAGLLFCWPLRRRRAGAALIALGTGLLLFFSHPLVAEALMRSLESSYPALTTVAGHEEAAFVAVLGEYHQSDPALPATSCLRDAALARLVEGIRIHRLLAGSRLVVSGAAPTGDPVAHAEAMAAAAEALGVDPTRIERHSEARDTAGEVAALARLARGRKVVLVTSASHLPRAMALARAAGLDPVPAPTEFRAKSVPAGSVWRWVPSARALLLSELALHEWLGRLWAGLGGR